MTTEQNDSGMTFSERQSLHDAMHDDRPIVPSTPDADGNFGWSDSEDYSPVVEDTDTVGLGQPVRVGGDIHYDDDTNEPMLMTPDEEEAERQAEAEATAATFAAFDAEADDGDEIMTEDEIAADSLDDEEEEWDDDTPGLPEEVPFLTDAELASDHHLRSTPAGRKKLNRQLIESSDGSTELIGEDRARARWSAQGFNERSDRLSPTEDVPDDQFDQEFRQQAALDGAREWVEQMRADEAEQRHELLASIPDPDTLTAEQAKRRARAIDNVTSYMRRHDML